MEPNANDCVQSNTDLFQDEETNAGVQFFPPLYLQRYMLGVEYLTKHSVQNVVDFGCSECGFFRLLSTVPSLQEISLVDIDRNLLMGKTRVISPEARHYIHRRMNPLKVFMYAGSAGDFDARMDNYQAVTLIEVIEHLEPDVLQLVTENVFGNIHPEHVVVTTPNSEFNVLFGNEDPTAFRHWDHKFEWTRQEFQTWCKDVCESYGYSVEYSGVGYLPSKPKSFDVGPCSQAALFRLCCRKEDINKLKQKTLKIGQEYEMIAESEFPFDDNPLTEEEKLDIEIMYTLRHIVRLKAECSGSWDGSSVCMEVCDIANRRSVKALASIQQVREYFKQKSYNLSEDGKTVTLDIDKLLYPEDEDDDNDDHDSNENERFNPSDENFVSGDDDGLVIENCRILAANLHNNVNGNCLQGLSRCDSDWDLFEKTDDGKT